MKKEISGRERKLIKKTRVKELIETYHGLLTDKEKKILSLYIDPNNNGALIARKLNISRQAVHDHIRRATGKMEKCDFKAHLVEIRKREKKLTIELEGMLDKIEAASSGDVAQKVKEAKEVLESIKKLL